MGDLRWEKLRGRARLAARMEEDGAASENGSSWESEVATRDWDGGGSGDGESGGGRGGGAVSV